MDQTKFAPCHMCKRQDTIREAEDFFKKPGQARFYLICAPAHEGCGTRTVDQMTREAARARWAKLNEGDADNA